MFHRAVCDLLKKCLRDDCSGSLPYGKSSRKPFSTYPTKLCLLCQGFDLFKNHVRKVPPQIFQGKLIREKKWKHFLASIIE